MLRLTVSLSLVLGLGAIAGGVVAPAALLATPDTPEDPVADWNKRWDKAIEDAAAEYSKLVKKYEKKLEATAAYTRRRILRYLPDDEETRKYLGYIKAKQSDGTDRWERVDTRRDVINELTDLDDPKATKYGKDLADADKKVANLFKGLARKATENGAAKDASADAKWTEKSQRAWERVLEVDDSSGNKDAEEAHKALGHPKADGKYVTPYKLNFLKARNDRKKSGDKTAHIAIKPADACEPDGMFVSAGLTGGGAKSTHFVVNSTHGKDVALRLVQACEKAMIDVCETYGFPETIKERVTMKFNVLKQDEAEYHKLLEKGGDMKPAEVQKLLDHHLGGTSVKGEFVDMSSGGADADDMCMAVIVATQVAQHVAPGMARADLGSSVKEGVDDWLWICMGYDVTKRVLGTASTTWGAFGRYGEAIEAKPNEDKWVELARRLVQTDDDVPLHRLFKLKFENQEFKPQPQIKGWAFLQFVFEKDPKKAQAFIWNTMANGTANAVAAIYPDNVDSPDPEKSMEKLDAEYREWITKGW